MDNSDDYIVEDISLDDETLAFLDQEEQRYLTSQKNTDTDPPPVSKKRRTDSGWKPGLTDSWNDTGDFENLPEISVHADGTYGVRNNTKNCNPFPLANPLDSDGRAINERSVARVSLMTTIQPCLSDAGGSSSRQTASNLESMNASIHLSSHSYAEGAEQRQNTLLEQRLRDLQKNMEEFSAENQKMQLALKQAIDMRLTKEGEVTILRKAIEKTAQEHAAQIASLKATKDEAEIKQVQIQKEMKEEMERVKTQFLFKQQEIESSLRRAPASARSNKVYRNPSRTPNRRFSQHTGGDAPEPSRLFAEQFVHQHAETPKLRRPLKSSRDANRTGLLPGFHNAFAISPSIRPRADIFCLENLPSSPAQRSPPSSPTRHIETNAMDWTTSARTQSSQHHDRTHDTVENGVGFMIAEDESVQHPEEPECPLIDWMSELSRIFLTHTLPNSSQTTLQLLLATSPAPMEPGSAQFATAGSEILRVIVNSPATQDYTDAVRNLCSPLTTVLLAVVKSNHHHNLRSLINLLTILVFSIPNFGTYLFSRAKGSTLSLFMDTLHEIIVHHLRATNTMEMSDSLANEILTFLEVVCLCGQRDVVARLAPLVLDNQVWTTLLHNGQPEWFLTRICRLLVLLTSHQTVAREFLKVSNAPASSGDKPTDSGEMLLVDRLCTFLNETNEPSGKAMKEHILTFVATLSASNPGSQATLVNNDYLIPSLVCFLSNLTTPLWEEDERVMETSHTVASLIRMTNQTVTLIHHLVFATESSFNLRLRLHHNPRRALAGLHHMFIVSCGRLSSADPPAQIDKGGRRELELVSDLARELLDLVVDGPESDSVWSLYHEDPDKNESETDEGEIEARLLGD